MAIGTEKSTWTIAFDKATGDHVSWDGYGDYDRKPATYTFKDVLEVRSYRHGRSSVTIALVDSQARLHHMSLSNFMDLVPDMVEGLIGGTWGYTKNGTNTHIVRID